MNAPQETEKNISREYEIEYTHVVAERWVTCPKVFLQ